MPSLPTRSAATSLLLALALLALPARAATVAGVRFADRLEAHETTLELCATGLLRYRVVFKGYAAALYRTDCEAPGDPLAPAPRRLELSYFWSIDGAMFGDAAEQSLRASLAPAEYAALEQRLATLHDAYRDVSPGDRYALTYLPGRGTELSLNGAPLVSVPGDDFAHAYFGIWLGEKPLSPDLRADLLGRPG